MSDHDEDDGIYEHMVEKQILPQFAAEELRKQGVEVSDGLVYVGEGEIEGWVKLTCIGCGRTAQIPEEKAPPPEKRAATCPDCLKAKGLI